MIKIKHLLICIISILIYTTNNVTLAQLEGFRVGAGIGYNIYLGTQMDEKISLNTYGKSELGKGYNIQAYKAINNSSEIGFRYLNTNIWSFLSANTLGINADINEFLVVYQKSINNNIEIDGSRVTVNAVLGLGASYYKSIFYVIDPELLIFSPLSSVGYGDIKTSTNLKINDKQITPILLGGINIGFRINRLITLYFENSFSISTTNKISGNLLRKSNIPPDVYSYHAISIYINYLKYSRVPKIKCPKL